MSFEASAGKAAPSPMLSDTAFGALVTRLVSRRDLTRAEARDAFRTILSDATSELQQGALLAALSAKGETVEELAGAWEAIYELDTIKVSGLPENSMDNCGTGMDSFKTFNISTAASLVAASAGCVLARHGARALSSRCGTVDVAEALGVDVGCGAETVASSIKDCGVGLFNGMSPAVHPGGLGRVLSKIRFGTTLNISASLANPASPALAVRGVHSMAALEPVAGFMRAIGYRRALLAHGGIDGLPGVGMDEASPCGTTHLLEFDGTAEPVRFALTPEEVGLARCDPADLVPEPDAFSAALALVRVLAGKDKSGRSASVSFNAGLALYVSGKARDIRGAVAMAAEIVRRGDALATLERWVACQNRDPNEGKRRLSTLLEVL